MVKCLEEKRDTYTNLHRFDWISILKQLNKESKKNNMTRQVVYTGKTFSSLIEYTRKIFYDLFIYRFAVQDFVKNNLRNRYRRSILGVLWTLLNPLLIMSTSVIAFSLVFRMDIKQFGVYVFSGMLPWNMISASASMGTMSLITAEGWLKKVYLPKIMFPYVIVNTEMVNHLLGLASIFIIMLVVRFPIDFSILVLPLNILILFIFTLGITIILSVLTVYFRDMSNIVQVVMQAFFYLNPIVYPLEMLPPFAQNLMRFNPFFYFINLFRKTLYEGMLPSFMDFLIPAGIALLSLLFALWILMRTEKDLIFRL